MWFWGCIFSPFVICETAVCACSDTLQSRRVPVQRWKLHLQLQPLWPGGQLRGCERWNELPYVTDTIFNNISCGLLNQYINIELTVYFSAIRVKWSKIYFAEFKGKLLKFVLVFSQNPPIAPVFSGLELKEPLSKTVRKPLCVICPRGCVTATMTVVTFLMKETVQVSAVFHYQKTFSFSEPTRGSWLCFVFFFSLLCCR